VPSAIAQSATESTRQKDWFSLADKNLPGGGLGAYSLPEDVRFVAVRGEGSRIQSADGRWYIDYVDGAGANILGHCHPAVVEAVQRQLTRGMHYYGALNDMAVQLAEKLVQLIPCAERLAFSTTGSEATFYALRLARLYAGRDKILKFAGGFHGNHDYSLVGGVNAGGVPALLSEAVLVAPYNDLTATEQIVAEHAADLAAIIVEPVQRIIFPQPGFLQGLRAICDRHDILLVFDEVVTGFRLALGGAQEYFGVVPDLACYGKVVGGGAPQGCVAGRAEIIEPANAKKKGQPGYAYCSGTLHGNPVATAAGLATIGELEKPGFYESLHARSDDLLKRLQAVLDRHGLPAIAAGAGSLWQLLFLKSEPANQRDMVNSDQDAMRRLDLELLRRGIYVLPGVRRFVCAANTEEDFEQTVAALDEACRLVA
jgi:glutamate-1-semialdehyde 2,1-aminomutase